MDMPNIVLLGLDSLIACLAIGPIVAATWRLPLATLFGVTDSAGFLVGKALGWHLPVIVTSTLRAGVLLLFGLYLIMVTLIGARVAVRWPIWVLPVALTLDNLTYGIVDDEATTNLLLAQAGSQALVSGAFAFTGLLVATALIRLLPQLDQHKTS